MDVEMPEMDGLDAARAISGCGGGGRPRVVALNASALPGDRERCLAAGMDDYVTKPIRPAELQRALAATAARNRRSSDVRAAEVSGDPTVLDDHAFDELREFLGAEAGEVIEGMLDSFRSRSPEMILAMRTAVDREGAAG